MSAFWKKLYSKRRTHTNHPTNERTKRTNNSQTNEQTRRIREETNKLDKIIGQDSSSHCLHARISYAYIHNVYGRTSLDCKSHQILIGWHWQYHEKKYKHWAKITHLRIHLINVGFSPTNRRIGLHFDGSAASLISKLFVCLFDFVCAMNNWK